MYWADVIIITLEVIIGGLLLLYKGHIEETVKTLHKRDQEYEKEKGKYDAIQESVQTILSDVEHMKSGVALEEQRRHHWIESRNQKLINLIRYSEIIKQSKVKLLVALNNESKTELETIRDEVNSTILNTRVDQLTLIAINPEINNKTMSVFADAILYLGNEVLVRTTNAISILDSFHYMFNHAYSLPDHDKVQWLQMANEKKNSLVAMKNNTNYEGDKGFDEKSKQYYTICERSLVRGWSLSNNHNRMNKKESWLTHIR